ncbi:MAG: flagellar biosynthetic protein FliQ [Vampirovibrionales bacterium]
MELLMAHIQKGILLSLVLSMPPILAAAAVGLLIGILQAVTQVQEQTITTVPKMLLVFGILIVGGGTMMELMHQFVRESNQVAFQAIPNEGGKRLLPPKPKSYYRWGDGQRAALMTLDPTAKP